MNGEETPRLETLEVIPRVADRQKFQLGAAWSAPLEPLVSVLGAVGQDKGRPSVRITGTSKLAADGGAERVECDDARGVSLPDTGERLDGEVCDLLFGLARTDWQELALIKVTRSGIGQRVLPLRWQLYTWGFALPAAAAARVGALENRIDVLTARRDQLRADRQSTRDAVKRHVLRVADLLSARLAELDRMTEAAAEALQAAADLDAAERDLAVAGKVLRALPCDCGASSERLVQIGEDLRAIQRRNAADGSDLAAVLHTYAEGFHAVLRRVSEEDSGGELATRAELVARLESAADRLAELEAEPPVTADFDFMLENLERERVLYLATAPEYQAQGHYLDQLGALPRRLGLDGDASVKVNPLGGIMAHAETAADRTTLDVAIMALLRLWWTREARFSYPLALAARGALVRVEIQRALERVRDTDAELAAGLDAGQIILMTLEVEQ